MNAPPSADDDLRLIVAMAAHGERYQALLRAYLNGPGRGMFVVSDAHRAQALIADYDHPTSRAEMRRYMAEQRRPVIVLASRNPGLPGTVWVRKPVDFETLASAAHRVWAMLSEVPSPAPATWRWLPTSVGGAAQRMDAGRPEREQPGPYRTPQRDDWTTKIAATTLGVLGIAALASVLGWRPAAQSWRPSSEAQAQALTDSSAAHHELVLAVQRALQESRRLSAAEREAVDAQLLEQTVMKPLPEPPAGFQIRGSGQESFTAAPTALPVDLLDDAPAERLTAAGPRQALREAVLASLAARPPRGRR